MKAIGIATAALILTAATSAQAQTVISRQIKSQPVETVVTRHANGSVTTQTHIMTSKPAAMTVQRAVVKKASVAAAPAQKVIYRTIVREVPVEAETVTVREPVTRWMPGLFGAYPVTTIEDRTVYTGNYHRVATPAYRSTVDATTYRTIANTPAYQVVADEDDRPVVRAYTTPVSYVVRY